MSTLKTNVIDTYTGSTITIASGKVLTGNGSGLTNIPFSAISDNAESIQDIIGAMVETNTENGIAVTYADPTGKLNFDVGDFIITLNGDLTGSGTVTNLGNVSINLQLGTGVVGSNEISADAIGSSEIADDININANELTVKPSNSTGAITARLDAWLDNVAVTGMTYNAVSDLEWVTYATGHKAKMVYTGDDLTSVEYYDTDSTSHIHTLTLIYTGGNLTSTTWTDI
jgi:hypothetical protein